MKSLNASLLCLVFASVLVGCPEDPKKPRPPVEEDAGFDAGFVEPEPEPTDGGTDGGVVELKITRLLPARGGAGGGNYVSIEGSGFVQGFAVSPTDARKKTTISFAGNPAQDFQIISDRLIDIRVPPGAPGSALVRLVNPNGDYACNGCYRYFEELFLQDVQPRSGLQRGGTEVVLTGSGFTADTQVLFGQLSSASVTFVSNEELRALTPKSNVTGPVDVVAYNQSGVGTIRNGFRYDPEAKVTGLSPAWGFIAGGEPITVSGAGLTGATEVRFGAGLGTSLLVKSDGELEVTAPAGSEGWVDVTVVTPRGNFTAIKAFTYVDGASLLSAVGVSPRIVSSGPTPGDVTIFGAGFDGPGLEVRIDGQVVAVQNVRPNELEVSVPFRAGINPVVSIEVEVDGRLVTLANALTYRVDVTSIVPFEGPKSGGTSAILQGDSIPLTSKVFIGPSEATGVNRISDSQLDFVTPAGSGGSQDVWVYDANDPENEVLVPGGFIYEEPLTIGAVLPGRGAIAGNTLVQVLGSGFREGMIVAFGSEKAKDLKVVNSHLVSVRAPKADGVGAVDVSVRYLVEEQVLPSAYSYFDPKSAYGGSSGGPFVGTLNVSVLESQQEIYGQPVPLVRVMVGNDGATPFQGFTDSRGQVTISDPALVKAPTVTVFKDGYESVTVTGVTSENLTVYVGRIAGEGGGGGGGGQPAPYSVIMGKVTGFKAPRPLLTGESLEARVYVAQGSVYYGWPWREPQRYPTVEKYHLTKDGDEYLVIATPGLRAVYTILGVKSGTTFTPYLMGIRRGINAEVYDPEKDNRVRDQNIALDMHLDVTVPVKIDGPAISYGVPAANYLFSWIDLGAEGVIPNYNNELMNATQATEIPFPHHPRLDGSNFIFMVLAYGAQTTGGAGAYSVFYRRQPGDLSQGLTMGPLLPLPQIDRPRQFTTFTGVVGWTHAPGPDPDIHNVSIERPTLAGPLTIWSVVMPGHEQSVSLPPPAIEKMRREEAGQALAVTMYSSRSPKFSYSQWTYGSLSTQSWTAFTIAFSEPFFP